MTLSEGDGEKVEKASPDFGVTSTHTTERRAVNNTAVNNNSISNSNSNNSKEINKSGTRSGRAIGRVSVPVDVDVEEVR